MVSDQVDHDHLPPPAQEIELRGILREHGETFVVFRCGNAERIVDAELREILPFDNFRRLVLDRLDVRIVYKRGRWLRDVVEAAERGGATITPEALSRALWINEASLPAAEADFLAEIMLSPVVRLAGQLGAAG